MTVSTVLALAAAAASLLLLMQARQRAFPTVALVASGVQVLLYFRILSISVSGASLSVVLGTALAVAGVVSWTQLEQKLPVTAAAVIATVGAVQVLAALF